VIEGKLQEVFLPPTRSQPASTVFAREWTTGQRVEVFQSVREWMRGMAASWTSGAMLVVDYGGATEDIYHRRPEGTLRAYRGQQRLTGNEIYELPGRQDITADVNFDDLAIWARELGWEADGIKSLGAIAPNAPGAEAFHYLAVAKG
jgi:SAM-dependent MidA family methyltransferase